MTAAKTLATGAALVAAIAVLTGCSTTSTGEATTAAVAPAADAAPSLSAQISAWSTGGGGRLTTTLSGDLGSVGDAGGRGDSVALVGACSTLQSDLETAQAYTPLPDSEAQQHWASALAWYSRSASDCISGASTMNASLITKSTGEMSNGTSELSETTDRINNINAGV